MPLCCGDRADGRTDGRGRRHGTWKKRASEREGRMWHWASRGP